MTRFVVCYDIADDRRRFAVARILDALGDRIQESVFELPVDDRAMRACIDRMTPLLDKENDSLIVYTLCAACDRKVQYFGKLELAPRIGDEQVYIV
ncbi:CRISPR-associated endonuclease Cas2 [Nitratireductor sp. XY-223]|uniref:CRISPR-associated endonuclease Cas2 n=1 Tax=Nitratireductor sp. XY-223 TaxID=2561926 RepID=UPI0010AA7C40|nr:CRISPR-associated endonuclease Cas2 [Nitratireductor sp. XY-223]